MSWVWQALGGGNGGSGGGGVAPVVLPALQPTLYAPLAQWSLDGVLTDRSGNGRNLTSLGPRYGADLIITPGALPVNHRCLTAAGLAAADTNQRATSADAAFQLTGDLTVTARVWFKSNGSPQNIVGSGVLGLNTDYFGCLVLSSGELVMTWSDGFGFTQVNTTAALVPGEWTFVSWRRIGADARMGLNTTYETVAGGNVAPVAGATELALLAIDPLAAANVYFQGGVADVCVWGTALSDAQILPLYQAAMGQ